MEVLQANLSKINIPNANSLVYKDECAFTFHTQESEGGILVDMNSFVGFSPEYALVNFRRTGHVVYLNIFKKRVPKKKADSENSSEKKVLGLGVVGGFLDRDSNFDFETSYALVLLPDYVRIELPNIEIPTKVQLAVDALIAVESASKKDQVTTFQLTNDYQESKYARDLVQLDNGVKIANQGWKCSAPGCDKTQNLWLNLSDGAILCGRKIVGFEGSGNGHALEHYKETGYPLVVKLGTISPDHDADVYSYAADEDDSVRDPLLEKHLLHWGIDLKEMKKTEKSLAEQEVEMQHTFEWGTILESGAQLPPLYGPGYTGIHNLGNTCYMASVMQVLFSIPQFAQRYHENAQTFFESPKKDIVPQDFHCQLAKFARGILSGDYSKPPTQQEIDEEAKRAEKLKNDVERSKLGLDPVSINLDPEDFPKFVERGVRPLMFKTLVGQGHEEFSTSRQQDALHFLSYLLDMIARNEHARADKDEFGNLIPDPSNVFKFSMENRLECGETNQVAYSNSLHSFVSLPLAPNRILNKEAVSEYEAAKLAAEAVSKEAANEIPVVYPQYNLNDLFENMFEPEMVQDFLSPASGNRTVAFKSSKFQTFPPYLICQVNKFAHDAGWIPKKVQISLNVPDVIDLNQFRGQGLQPNEVELPKSSEPAPQQASTKPQWDEEVVSTLVSMDIPAVRAQRASHFTMGKGFDAAMEWVFSHCDDPDIDEPLPAVSSNASSGSNASAPPEELVMQVMDMGFDRKKAEKSLKNTGNDVGRAIEWLFSHPDDNGDDEPAAASTGNSAVKLQDLSDGNGTYKLFAFISHMGNSTMSGHYVCHILKEGKWVSFNDEKVAESLNPPRDMGYIYFFKRI